MAELTGLPPEALQRHSAFLGSWDVAQILRDLQKAHRG